ncbi:MAG TPA: chemotaxis protein CheW [Pyrinomonadaceae bacterium]|jgi:purine-binding chemotaxis protein CheW
MNDFVQEKPIGARSIPPIGFSDSVNLLEINEDSEQADGEKFLVFYLNEQLYGISAHNVAEVTQPVPIAALPDSPEWLLGIGNLRGEIMAVADLPAIIGEKSKPASSKTKLIVLNTHKYDTAIAFSADKLCEIAALNEKARSALRENESPYVYAQLSYQSKIVRLIDCAKLLKSLAGSD